MPILIASSAISGIKTCFWSNKSTPKKIVHLFHRFDKLLIHVHGSVCSVFVYAQVVQRLAAMMLTCRSARMTQERLLVASTASNDIDTVNSKTSMNTQCYNEYGHYCFSGHNSLFATPNQVARIGVIVTSAFSPHFAILHGLLPCHRSSNILFIPSF